MASRQLQLNRSDRQNALYREPYNGNTMPMVPEGRFATDAPALADTHFNAAASNGLLVITCNSLAGFAA